MLLWLLLCVLKLDLLLTYRVSYAEINGTVYKKKTCVLHFFDEEIPIFVVVSDILVTLSGDCLFVLIPYVGNSFFPHFNAYEVWPNHSAYIVCRQRDLADHHPLTISKSFGSCFSHRTLVSLKHHVFSYDVLW